MTTRSKSRLAKKQPERTSKESLPNAEDRWNAMRLAPLSRSFNQVREEVLRSVERDDSAWALDPRKQFTVHAIKAFDSAVAIMKMREPREPFFTVGHGIRFPENGDVADFQNLAVAEFCDHYQTLLGRLPRAEALWERCSPTWPSDNLTKFGRFACESAARTALSFTEAVTAVAMMSGSYAQVDATQLPVADPILAEWRAKTILQLGQSTIWVGQPTEAELSRDSDGLRLLIEDEFKAAVRHKPIAGQLQSTQCKPVWNRDTGELTLNGHLAKRVKNLGPACNVVKVLEAFQEDDWPARIDDPLSHPSGANKVNDTVRSLNKGLSAIRFSADGTAKGFRWQYC